ncbi:unnamed protein product [Mortierella alpina]
MLQNDFWGHVIGNTKDFAEHLPTRVSSRYSHAADVALVTDLVHNSNYPRSADVSRADLWSTFGVHSDQYDNTPQRCSMLSLWEIQLELGEIPDLLSNNLLMPCWQENHVGSTLSLPQTHSPPAWRLARQGSDDGHEILQELEEERSEGEDEESVAIGGQDSRSASEPVDPRSIYLFKSKRFGATTGEREAQEHEDGDETEEDREDNGEEKEQGSEERAKQERHPVYGILRCAQGEEMEDEYRHDRKDSGVFMQGPDDELEALWVQGIPSLGYSLTMHASCWD